MSEIQETTTQQTVQFTPSAITELKRIKAEQNPTDNKVLRVGVKGGGCAGFSYILEFDKLTSNDTTFEIDDLTIAIDFSHQLYLNGTLIDFGTGLEARGFTFQNPNAQTTCGCGSSFG